MHLFDLCAVGVNHHTANLHWREKLAFDQTTIPRALDSLIDSTAASHAAIVSTCNRTEFYASNANPELCLQWLVQYKNLDLSLARSLFFSYTNRDAAKHLFNVAAGLDSIVIGENQIQSQLKSAYATAKNNFKTNWLLNKLFESSFAAAKEARHKTTIGASSISLCLSFDLPCWSNLPYARKPRPSGRGWKAG